MTTVAERANRSRSLKTDVLQRFPKKNRSSLLSPLLPLLSLLLSPLRRGHLSGSPGRGASGPSPGGRGWGRGWGREPALVAPKRASGAPGALPPRGGCRGAGPGGPSKEHGGASPTRRGEEPAPAPLPAPSPGPAAGPAGSEEPGSAGAARVNRGAQRITAHSHRLFSAIQLA